MLPPGRFQVWGPIRKSDLAGLTARVCTLLRGFSGSVAYCDVVGVTADAVTVDALARLQLAAQRSACSVRLCNASAELLELVEAMGLRDVLPGEESVVEPGG